MEKSRAIELLEHLAWDRDIDRNPYGDALNMAIEALKAQLSKGGATSDLIDRQAAIDIVVFECGKWTSLAKEISKQLKQLPSAQPEPLTDKEQRIFLAAMGREEKVCEEVDRNYVREPYEDSLIRVCKEIRRKVKGALWT